MTDHLGELTEWGMNRQPDGTFTLQLGKKYSRDTYTLTQPKLEELSKLLAAFLAQEAAS